MSRRDRKFVGDCITFSFAFLLTFILANFRYRWLPNSTSGIFITALLPMYIILRVIVEPIMSMVSTITNVIYFILFRPILLRIVVVLITACYIYPSFRQFCYRHTLTCFWWFLTVISRKIIGIWSNHNN